MCVLNTCVLRKSSCKHYRKKNTFSDCRLCGGCFHKLLSPNTSNIRWRKRKPSSRIFATLAFHATIFCFGCDDNKEDISTSTVHRHQKKCDSNSIVQIEDKRQSVWKNRQSVCFTQNVLHLWLLAVIGLGTYICVCLSRADCCHAPQFLLGNLRKPIDTTNNVSREIRSWCVLQK